MKVFINGEPRELGDGATVAELLRTLEFDPRHVAVECNRELAPRSEHATTALNDGDRLEIVTLVGGG